MTACVVTAVLTAAWNTPEERETGLCRRQRLSPQLRLSAHKSFPMLWGAAACSEPSNSPEQRWPGPTDQSPADRHRGLSGISSVILYYDRVNESSVIEGPHITTLPENSEQLWHNLYIFTSVRENWQVTATPNASTSAFVSTLVISTLPTKEWSEKRLKVTKSPLLPIDSHW